MAPRILLCGDVLGRLNQLFKRVSSVLSFPRVFFSIITHSEAWHGTESISFHLTWLLYCRWTNLQVHSTRSCAWVSSSLTHRSSSRTSRNTSKVDLTFLFRRTSSATTASPPPNFSCKLPRTPPTKASRWTASRFATTCIGWKAVANSLSLVQTFFLLLCEFDQELRCFREFCVSYMFQLYAGLSVAYLSGRKSSSGQQFGNYTEDDVDALRAIAEEPGVVDLFLTYPSIPVHYSRRENS